MRFLQHVIESVLRIPSAIVLQGLDFVTKVFSRAIILPCVFVNVVAQMHNKIEVFNDLQASGLVGIATTDSGSSSWDSMRALFGGSNAAPGGPPLRNDGKERTPRRTSEGAGEFSKAAGSSSSPNLAALAELAKKATGKQSEPEAARC